MGLQAKNICVNTSFIETNTPCCATAASVDLILAQDKFLPHFIPFGDPFIYIYGLIATLHLCSS